jgi:hypothetical protein
VLPKICKSHPTFEYHKTALDGDITKTKRKIKLKVKLKSHPNTGLDSSLELHEVEANTRSRNLGHEGDKVVSPTHRPPLLSRRYS